MKYYKGRREADKGLITRILIVVLVCLLAFVITVFVGNRLKAKLDRLDSQHGVGGDSTSPPKESQSSTPSIDEKNDTQAEDRRVFAAHATLADLAQEIDLADTFDNLADDGYTAIALPLTNSEGSLLYASSVAVDHFRADFPDSYYSVAELTKLVALAEDAGLRTIAIYYAPDLFADSDAAASRISTDELLAREIADIGFDEIMLLGCIGEDGVNIESTVTVLDYVAALRRSARKGGASPDIALAIDYRYFLDASCAQQIELFAEYIEVLTIDTRGHENPAALCDSLSGSFSLYSLRAITDSADTADEIKSYAASNVIYLPQ